MNLKSRPSRAEKTSSSRTLVTTEFLVSILLAAFSISGCRSSATNTTITPGSGNTTTTITTDAATTATSTTTNSVAKSVSVSEASLSKVVCDSTATRMTPDAEKFTKESWQCKHKGESLRIDIYSSSEQQTNANQTVLDYYKGMNDNRALSELPILCGDNWAIGSDFNETRDALIVLLHQNGYTASACK